MQIVIDSAGAGGRVGVVARTLHMTIDIRGALGMPKRVLRSMFIDESGRHATAEQAREHLLDLLQEGKKRLPLGEPRDGFSYETGCPGHEEG